MAKRNFDDDNVFLKETHYLGARNVNDRDCSSTCTRTPISSIQSTPSGTLDKQRYNKRSKLAFPHPLKDFLQSFSSYDKRLEINNEFNKLEIEDETHHVKKRVICQNQSPEMDR